MLGVTWVFVAIAVLSIGGIGVFIFLYIRYRNARLACEKSEAITCPQYVCPNGSPATI